MISTIFSLKSETRQIDGPRKSSVKVLNLIWSHSIKSLKLSNANLIIKLDEVLDNKFQH